MRVLHLAKYYPPYKGGMETFLRDLAVGTKQIGVENLILAHHSGADRMTLCDEFVEGVRVVRVPTPFSLLYAPISPSYVRHLRALVKAFQPDVIHAHLPNLSAFWALSLSEDIPLVVHWHADVVFPPAKLVHRVAYVGYRQLEKRLLVRASAVIATSPQYQAASKALAAVAHKVVSIPLGVDEQRLAKPEEQAVALARHKYAQDDALVFVSVGRFAHYKGFHVLVDAVAKLPDSLKARVVIVGGGEEYSRIEHQIAAASLGGRVVLAGRLADEELAALLHAADAYCLPSIERSEAFGVVLLEAMAAAKPVVSSSIQGSGVCHVVEDGVTGVQCIPNDSAALAKAMQLMTKPVLRQKMGEAGRQRFDELFTMKAVAKRTSALYQKVVGV